MGKLPALVTALSQTDGRDEKTISHVARLIRERGYIKTGKRGSGAADMTAQDAANLIIGLCGSDTHNEAPVAIDRFRSLRPWFSGNSKNFRERADILDHLPQPLQEISDCLTFGTALETMIENASELSEIYNSSIVSAGHSPKITVEKSLSDYLAGLRVTFTRGGAEITSFGLYVEGSRVDDLSFTYRIDDDRFMDGFYGSWLDGDRKTQVSIGFRTLLAAKAAIMAVNNED